MSILLRFDGACKGNPGPGGSAAVLYKDGEPIHTCYYYHPQRTTNNIAEYLGLLGGLRMALAHGYKNLMVQGDSKLVIEQVFGKWKCKHPGLTQIHQAVRETKKKFDSIYGTWIPRERNQDADHYSNVAMEKKGCMGEPSWFQIGTAPPSRPTPTVLFPASFGVPPPPLPPSPSNRKRKNILDALGIQTRPVSH